jgi:cell division protein FtsW (lipid II flippase)
MVDPIGPQYFPKILAFVTGIFGLLLAIKSILPFSVKKNQQGDDAADELEKMPWSLSTFRAFGMILIPALYILMLPYLGYILSMLLSTFVLLLILREKHWVKIIIMSCLLPLVLFAVFHYGLKVILPTGKIF